MSYAWMTLAAESGDKYIKEVKDKINSKLSQEEKTEANRLASEWRAVYQT
jgi:hypothetical protein